MGAARQATGETLLAHFRADAVCDRLMHIPVSRLKQPRWWWVWVGQVVGLLLCAVAVFFIAIWPAVAGSLEALGISVP